MQILTHSLTVKQLDQIAKQSFYNLVKAVVDLEKSLVAIDSPLHADLEALLIRQGSNQKNLWGINLHPSAFGTDDFVEFDSMINLRPNQNNPSRSVLDPDTRDRIIQLVNRFFTHE